MPLGEVPNTNESKLLGGISTKVENTAAVSAEVLNPTHQTSQMLHSGGSPVQSLFLGQKVKEDVFVKNNLEYEQRLKAHLYQFEEEDQRKGRTRSIEDSQASERHESRTYARETPGGPEGTASQMASQPGN